MKVFKVVTTIKYYKIVSAQMDAGARSDTAAGIRLPRYPPGKQTKVGGRRPLTIIRSDEFSESKLLCDASKNAPVVC